MNGAQYIAETLSAKGVDHVFLVLAILRKSLVEMEKLGIKRVVAHSEKGATYMADGYARVSHKPSVSMSQSVGAANLAAGLQDAFLGHSPVIALTGRKPPLFQYRNAYQEILHGPMFDQVTKYNSNIDEAAQLPFILQQLFREATTGAPRPVHADLLGLSGEMIEEGEVRVPVQINRQYSTYPASRPMADPYLVQEALKLIEQAARPIIVDRSSLMPVPKCGVWRNRYLSLLPPQMPVRESFQRITPLPPELWDRIPSNAPTVASAMPI